MKLAGFLCPLLRTKITDSRTVTSLRGSPLTAIPSHQEAFANLFSYFTFPSAAATSLMSGTTGMS
jgi:hypothetical protein